MYKYFIFIVLLFSVDALIAQTEKHVSVRDIEMEGNDKTRAYIIIRELDFRSGDSILISELPDRLKRSENNLINTLLFSQVVVNVSEWDTDLDVIDIKVELQESWYFFLIPIVELADRNFNVWWNEFNGALNRLNLGLRFTHLNLSGNADRLKLLGQFGFTRKMEVEYGFPYLNRSKTLGAVVNFLHATNKETGYINFENKLLFTEQDERIMLRRNRLRTSLIYRPNIYAFHEFTTEFQNNKADLLISDTLNPHFFLDGRTRQSFLSLSYRFRYDKRDIQIYPLEGMSIEFALEKAGIGIWNDVDLLIFKPTITKYIRPSSKLSLGTNLLGKISIIRDQPPFYQNRGLGYGDDFIRGYELYVIDGQDYFLMKNSIKFQFVKKNIDFGDAMFIRQLRVMPLQIFFALNFDAGYVNEMFYEQNNDFTNRWLYGGGPGIDVILYNIFLFQFELSSNHLGEVGLFFHYSVSF